VFETRLKERGIPSRLLKSLSNSILDILTNTKHDDNFEWIFKSRTTTEVEAEYSNSNQTVIIDRLFIDDGKLWIIDFKTASLSKDETINEFIERQKLSHQQQIEKYKEVLTDFFELPSRAAIYCPAVSQLILL
jgi:ATP-dependent exoDNAse (exonuclease V) beta subunit